MARHFHVTSSLNRASIERHGLDWTRMAAAKGIAGSHRPEQAGCFLCRNEFEMEWFVDMNNTRGPVDVWLVDGVDDADLVESPEGFMFLPGAIAVSQLVLWRQDCPPRERR